MSTLWESQFLIVDSLATDGYMMYYNSRILILIHEFQTCLVEENYIVDGK